MEAEIIRSYWWVGLIYFAMGFSAYYIIDRNECRRYGLPPFNGVLAGLLVATMWGVLWSVLLFAMAFAKVLLFFEAKITERLGRSINILSVIFCWAWIATTIMFLYPWFREPTIPKLGSLVLFLFWLFIGYSLFKSITAPRRKPFFWGRQMEADFKRLRLREWQKREIRGEHQEDK